jgi:chromosome segregation ATPase
MREVQKTTAMRVFARFFKKAEPVDAETQVEEDPLQLELDALKAQMATIERERIREKIEVEKIKMSEEQLNKQIKNLYSKLREANSELSFTKDTLEASNAKVKQL